MKIDATAALDHPEHRYAFDMQESPVGWEFPLDIDFIGDIRVYGMYWSKKGSVYMQGNIAARLDAQCSRCLQSIEYPIDIEFEWMFSQQEDIDNGVYALKGKQMILDKLILDEISLVMPLQYLCKPDCKGLCPKCGKNRNTEVCECNISSNGLNPFEQLKDLF